MAVAFRQRHGDEREAVPQPRHRTPPCNRATSGLPCDPRFLRCMVSTAPGERCAPPSNTGSVTADYRTRRAVTCRNGDASDGLRRETQSMIRGQRAPWIEWFHEWFHGPGNSGAKRHHFP